MDEIFGVESLSLIRSLPKLNIAKKLEGVFFSIWLTLYKYYFARAVRSCSRDLPVFLENPKYFLVNSNAHW